MERHGIEKTLKRVIFDIAYACFLVPAVTVLIPAVLSVLPVQWDDASAAGVGFFILIPLVMLSGLCALAGIVCSVVLRKDWRLPALSVATVAVAALFVAADEGAWISPEGMNLIAVLYLGFCFYCVFRWFFFARWRAECRR